MRMFALRDKENGKLVGFETESNDGDSSVGFCVGTTFTLSFDVENVWVTTCKQTALEVSKFSESWYNASFSSPVNPYVGILEVVELKVL